MAEHHRVQWVTSHDLVTMNAHTAQTSQCAVCAPGHGNKADTFSLHALHSQVKNLLSSLFISIFKVQKAQMQTISLFACTFVYLP